MGSNGRRRPQRPQIAAVEPAPTDKEAAAISAALEQFLYESAPTPKSVTSLSPWRRSANYEATGQSPAVSSWGDGTSWGNQ